jgi:hypothetical protein
LAYEASPTGLLSPELAAGSRLMKSAKRVGGGRGRREDDGDTKPELHDLKSIMLSQLSNGCIHPSVGFCAVLKEKP